ncbi:IS630 transposase-related protein [Synergistes jonesii]|uniref:IS630 transposase-related protein n=1 Tax=Synergistes jonesii TaxID=2754 RepID=UPI0009DD4990
MTCYSKDLRERAIKYLLGGHTPNKTSKVFNVGKTALWRWKKQLEEQVDLEDKPRGEIFQEG